jgi:protoporphyrinogen oxidase
MANVIYNNLKTDLLNGGIDLDTDTIKVMLVTSSYTPSASHNFRSSVTNEVSGTGYSAGGEVLANATVSDVAGVGVLDGDDVTWSNSTITARGAVIYKDTGNASTDNLIGYVDFVSDQTSSDGSFTIQWNASGIIRLS